MQKLLFLFISLTTFFINLYAQEIKNYSYPLSDFRQPLDLTPSLSSAFGEIRTNHFHSGLDYRTNQREGYPVYAVADGYVSRLRVQIGGFGNAIYLSHANGYTSVYAHLQRFNSRLARTVKDYQYNKQSFEADFPLFPINIPVKKGDVIAWSGNTGSSSGPHLHFEIRDSKTEEIINPRLFGIEIADNVKPVISGIYIYRLNGQPFSEKTSKQYFQAISSDGKYYLDKSPLIRLNNEASFGIRASDQTGIYSTELKIDQKTIYLSAFERFHFDHSLAVNSYIDYPALLSSGISIRKSFVEPGNPLLIYKAIVNNGLVNPNDEEVHKIEYIVKDVKGHTSTLFFKVKFEPANQIQVKESEGTKKFFYNQLNEFATDALKISIPRGALYSDINFVYSETKKIAGSYSPVYHVHTRLIPLNVPYEIRIRPDTELAAGIRDKALIRDTRGDSYESSFEDGYVKAMPGSFGSFYITADTTPPVIRAVNITIGKSMAGISKIIFKISDSLSGIKSFNGTIDGKWVLMEFDKKTATLWHTFDERTSPGKHVFELDVSDSKSNTKSYTTTFYR